MGKFSSMVKLSVSAPISRKKKNTNQLKEINKNLEHKNLCEKLQIRRYAHFIVVEVHRFLQLFQCEANCISNIFAKNSTNSILTRYLKNLQFLLHPFSFHCIH